MISEDQILTELQKINQTLAKQNSGRVALNSFVAGFCHAFGNLIGSIVIFFILIYFASLFNWTGLITKSFEDMMSQINWSKMIPAPKIQFP